MRLVLVALFSLVVLSNASLVGDLLDILENEVSDSSSWQPIGNIDWKKIVGSNEVDYVPKNAHVSHYLPGKFTYGWTCNDGYANVKDYVGVLYTPLRLGRGVGGGKRLVQSLANVDLNKYFWSATSEGFANLPAFYDIQCVKPKLKKAGTVAVMECMNDSQCQGEGTVCAKLSDETGYCETPTGGMCVAKEACPTGSVCAQKMDADKGGFCMNTNREPEESSVCIKVSGSPSYHSWCDGIYQLSGKTVLGWPAYVNKVEGGERTLYWASDHGGKWQIDDDYNAAIKFAYFSSPKMTLPATGGNYYDNKWNKITNSKIEYVKCQGHRQLATEFDHIGVGYCRPANCELTNGECRVSGFIKDGLGDESSCKDKCQKLTACSGYAWEPEGTYSSRCIMYGMLGSVSGWETSTYDYTVIARSSGGQDYPNANCYARTPHELRAAGDFCSLDTMVSSVSECKAAAAELGITTWAGTGSWESAIDIHGCQKLANQGNKAAFNTRSGNGASPHAQYQPICRVTPAEESVAGNSWKRMSDTFDWKKWAQTSSAKYTPANAHITYQRLDWRGRGESYFEWKCNDGYVNARDTTGNMQAVVLRYINLGGSSWGTYQMDHPTKIFNCLKPGGTKKVLNTVVYECSNSNMCPKGMVCAYYIDNAATQKFGWYCQKAGVSATLAAKFGV